MSKRKWRLHGQVVAEDTTEIFCYAERCVLHSPRDDVHHTSAWKHRHNSSAAATVVGSHLEAGNNGVPVLRQTGGKWLDLNALPDLHLCSDT